MYVYSHQPFIALLRPANLKPHQLRQQDKEGIENIAYDDDPEEMKMA
jgi:hypothetical protein